MPPKRKKPSKAPASDPTSKRLKLDADQDTGQINKEKKKTQPLKRKETFDINEILKITHPPKDSWLFQYLEDSSWKDKLCGLFCGDTFQKLESDLSRQYEAELVFPPKDLIFNAFNLTPFTEVKVVILGQDPYHDNGQAHGLSFSVPVGVQVPRSLKNIYKELSSDCPGFVAPDHGCLESWGRRGVLLLNATLTVVAHQPNSHSRLGWQDFTDKVIKVLSHMGPPMVFILWGGFAHKKEGLIDQTRHRVVKTAHPSPLSFNKFSGCKCFSVANAALRELGRDPVDWSV